MNGVRPEVAICKLMMLPGFVGSLVQGMGEASETWAVNGMWRPCHATSIT